MSQVILGILVLIILPAVVAGSIFAFRSKEAKGIVIKTVMFYIMLFFLIISVLKTMLGEGEFTIAQSLSENSIRTYLHYAIPLAVLAIVIPFLHIRLRNILKNGKDNLAEISLLTYYVFFLTGYVYDGTVLYSNFAIMIVGLAGFLLYLGSLLLKLNWTIDYSKDSICAKTKRAVPIFLFFAVTVIFFVPNQLYLKNVSEFHAWYPSFALVLLVQTLLFIILATIGGVLVVPDKGFNSFLCLIFGVTICCYIQENFLNGSLATLDGIHQTWNQLTVFANIAIWIVMIAAVVFLYYKFRDKAVKIIRYISIYIMLMQVVTVGYLALTTDWNKGNDNILTSEKVFDMNPENNVVVFILDWYDEQIMDKIVSDDPEFLEPLDGFTWYRNQTSKYSFTAMSIPYLLTGTEWEKGTTEEEYALYAFEKSNFLQDIKKQNYDVGVYTESQMVSNKDNTILNYMDQNHRTCDVKQTIQIMNRCSRYQIVPFALKENFWYETNDIRHIVSEEYMYSLDNIEFYNALTTQKMNISDVGEKGAFRFYHIMGTHDMVMKENITLGKTDTFSEGRGVMKIVYEYLDQMKELGIYDSSTIIITADHGQNHFNTPERLEVRQLQLTSNPTLLVKEAGEKGKVKISDAPVTHAELQATVIDAVGGDGTKYGKRYKDIPEDTDVVREMIYYRTGNIPYKKYLIHGKATDLKSWSVEK